MGLPKVGHDHAIVVPDETMAQLRRMVAIVAAAKQIEDYIETGR